MRFYCVLVDDKGWRHRDRALLKQNVASFVVGILGIMVFIATGSKVGLVLTMAILFFLPPISRFRAWRNRPKK